jgi:hypothetical protein
VIAFRDDEQRRRVCRVLLSSAGLPQLWGDRGPTPLAQALVERGGGDLSRAELAVLHAGWQMWRGAPLVVTFAEIVGTPQGEPLLRLLVAAVYGPDAIDVWLSRPVPDGFIVGPRQNQSAAARLFDEARAMLAESQETPIDYSSAPDACALGAKQMADFALVFGVEPIAADDERHAHAVKLAAQALSTFATLSGMGSAEVDPE